MAARVSSTSSDLNVLESLYGEGILTGGFDLDSSEDVKSFMVKATYPKSQPDELEINVGERVELIHEFDDGWAKGRNLETDQVGIFPLACLAD